MIVKANRRDVSKTMAAGLALGLFGTPLRSAAMTLSSPERAEVSASLLDYLDGLEDAVAKIAMTWKPDDPRYRADIYRQVLMNLSYAYFVYFFADAEHPDWTPLFNPVFMQQPNPDTLYQSAPLRGDLTYRISGNRGTCNSLLFTAQQGFTGSSPNLADYRNFSIFDGKNLKLDANGDFELLLSQQRPAGYTGNFLPIQPDTNWLMVRYVAQDWAAERDPQMSILCLDDVPLKPRLTSTEILDRIQAMAQLPANMDEMFFTMQNQLKSRVGINRFDLFVQQGVEFQHYWPAVFEFGEDEALIIECEMPDERPYWNLQLNDPYFNAVEYVYRLSSTNGHFARLSSDGKFRAVVSLRDPGVPNWLDSAGFTEGTLWGRWSDCSSTPIPTIKKVKFSGIRQHLPADTPIVTLDDRAQEIRDRARACQRRRRW